MATEAPAEAPWIDAVAVSGEGGAPLGACEIRSWRDAGFALVSDLLPRELLERAAADARALFPPPDSRESAGQREFGSGGRMQFPSGSQAVDETTLHPRLLAAVAQLLGVGVRELRLTQSDLWPKYGRQAREGDTRQRYDNEDQRIHVDYPNHTLLHPPRWHEPEAVEIILYLCDVDACGGPTAVVPREGPDDPAYRYPIVDTPGVGALEWVDDRASAEAYLAEAAPDTAQFRAQQLYPRERYTRYRFGDLLLYRHDTWHRGTPLRPGALRLVQNLTFKRAASEWVSVLHSGWAWGMYRPGQPTERLVACASVDQRCVLGIPAPGHAYWNPETLAALKARYGPLGMDTRPYEEG